MINFNDPKDQSPSAFAVLGIALAVGASIFLFLSRGNNANSIRAKFNKDEIQMTKDANEAKANLAEYQRLVDAYQWQDKEDVVTPSALTIISKRAEANKLKLISFRPQKSVETDAQVQLPMQFTVDGSFANVANMLDQLKKDSKLAVQQVQFASQEGETDQVSANVSLYAFILKPKKASSSTTTSAPATTSAGVKTNG